MSEKVLLPFHVPLFATTQGMAAPGIAIENHPTAFNGILNQCTTISCTRRFLRGYTSPQTEVPRLGIYSFSYLNKYAVSFRFAHRHSLEIIKKMLDEGFYIYFSCVDDFYLPEKSWYGIRHLAHDGIICGYDETDATYSIAAYDINWIFRLIQIPQKCFAEGLDACIENKQFGAITAYKMKDIEVKLEEPAILKYLKEHLDTTIDKVSLESNDRVNGIAVHDLLAMYIDKLKDGSIPSDKMDWRALRPVWEHKRCMLERLKAVETKHNWDPAFSEQYAPLVDLANRIRMMYAVYHKTRKTSLLDGIRNGLTELSRKEYDILTDFVGKMEEEQV